MQYVYLVHTGVDGGEAFLWRIYDDMTKALNALSEVNPYLKNVERNEKGQILLTGFDGRITRWGRVTGYPLNS